MRLRIRGRRRPDVRRFDGGENVDHKVKFSDDPSAIPRAPTISPLPPLLITWVGWWKSKRRYRK